MTENSEKLLNYLLNVKCSWMYWIYWILNTYWILILKYLLLSFFHLIHQCLISATYTSPHPLQKNKFLNGHLFQDPVIFCHVLEISPQQLLFGQQGVGSLLAFLLQWKTQTGGMFIHVVAWFRVWARTEVHGNLLRSTKERAAFCNSVYVKLLGS